MKLPYDCGESPSIHQLWLRVPSRFSTWFLTLNHQSPERAPQRCFWTARTRFGPPPEAGVGWVSQRFFNQLLATKNCIYHKNVGKRRICMDRPHLKHSHISCHGTARVFSSDVRASIWAATGTPETCFFSDVRWCQVLSPFLVIHLLN
jgi:hypothetical protein